MPLRAQAPAWSMCQHAATNVLQVLCRDKACACIRTVICYVNTWFCLPALFQTTARRSLLAAAPQAPPRISSPAAASARMAAAVAMIANMAMWPGHT